jgi:branched-chain amino acid aminotransferase
MPCFIRQLTPAGLQPVNYSGNSLVDAGQHEPQGVYTITNTYPNLQALKLDAHLARLEDSAQRDGIALTLDRAGLRAALRQVIVESGWDVVRFRITIPRETPEQPILSVEPFQPPAPEVYANGIRCVTVTSAHRDNPAAKTTGWMTARQSVQSAFPPGVTEGLLISESGAILEGLSSNFYAIIDGTLYTAEEGVLPGIGRQVVYEVAPSIVPLVREPVQASDIPRLDEAFITSASRGIVPVVEIDGVQLGSGKPGPMTQSLSAAYRDWVAAHLEDI